MHNFTPEDLLRFLYKETSPTQTAQILAALESDWSLREKLEVISSARKRLKKLSLSPSKRTIENIMNYAEKGIVELSPQF
jgi:hypothetical protein